MCRLAFLYGIGSVIAWSLHAKVRRREEMNRMDKEINRIREERIEERNRIDEEINRKVEEINRIREERIQEINRIREERIQEMNRIDEEINRKDEEINRIREETKRIREETKRIEEDTKIIRDGGKTGQASNDEIVVFLNKPVDVAPEIGDPSPCKVEHQPTRRKYLFSLISSMFT
jgi:uncharacterized protein YoxC